MNENRYNPDIIYKFMFIGDSGVGKTCIMKRLSEDKFCTNAISTIGVDLKTKDYVIEVEENGKKIKKKIQIKFYDTAGQERFQAFTKDYFNKANGLIMVYDITDKKSFDNIIKRWMSTMEKVYGNSDDLKSRILLFGNKSDLAEDEEKAKKKKREVGKEEPENLSKEYGFIWGGECSALKFTKSQFDEIIIKFIKIIYEKFPYEKPPTDRISLTKNDAKKQTKKNCKC